MKKKTETSLLDYELELISHAILPNEQRPHLQKPFAVAFAGKTFLCGTDGHRCAMVASDNAHKFARADGPPLAQIIEAAGVQRQLTTIDADAIEPLEQLPSKWRCMLAWRSPGTPPTLTASTLVGRGNNARKVSIFSDALVHWSLRFELLPGGAQPKAMGMEARYLVDAVRFVGTRQVCVWGSGPLDPLFLVGPGRTLADATTIAIVMPARA